MLNDILNFSATLRWQDFLDIGINSFIVFRLYILFRGTHTFKVMLAIAGLWFAQRFADYLDLIVTSWVIQGVTAVLVIIIIVVFRSEIRAVFQTRSIGAILWELPRRQSTSFIDIIPETVFEMASGRIGAILVFCGKEDISEITKGGVPWQGIVSKEMIKSIFWRNNPVHDGAAIIDGERVAAVGCVLPLTMQKDLPTYFGTRHRAALGLAEASDALVVMISEESGKILTFKDSKYKEIIHKEDLHKTLVEHTSGKETARQRFGSESVRLGIAALFSCLMAAVVWLNITRGQDTLITYEVPLKFINQQTGLKIIETSTDHLVLHLNGPAPLIKRLVPSEVQLEIDLGRAVIGNNPLKISPKDIRLPPGIALESMKPNTVDVLMDTIVIKNIPVQVDWSGALARDKRLVQCVWVPKSLKVKGPSLKLKDVVTIYTQPVILNGLQQSGRISVKPVLPAFIELLPAQNDMIHIVYQIEARE